MSSTTTTIIIITTTTTTTTHLYKVSTQYIDDIMMTKQIGIWIEEQIKDTNRQKETKQAEELKKGKPGDRIEHLANHQVACLTA
uniref:Uncharacterized protein n=1 Tax=Solanum tuberosum TaxID=4113 RepID=M1DSU9_SOLTU